MLESNFVASHKVKGQGHESHGSLHSCECWLLLVLISPHLFCYSFRQTRIFLGIFAGICVFVSRFLFFCIRLSFVYFLLAPVSLAVTINVRCRTMHLNLRILLCFFLLSPPGGVGKDYVVRLVLFVCFFVRSDLSLTTISHERLEQYWWNLQGIFTSPYWWLDYILEVKSWRSRSLLAVEVAEASTSTLVRQSPCYVHAYCVLCYGSFLFGAIHMLSLLTVTFLVWLFLVDVCFCYVRFSLSIPCLVIGWEQRLWNDLPLGYPHPPPVCQI